MRGDSAKSTFSNCGKEENDFILNDQHEFNPRNDDSVVRNSYQKYTRIRLASHENTGCVECV